MKYLIRLDFHGPESGAKPQARGRVGYKVRKVSPLRPFKSASASGNYSPAGAGVSVASGAEVAVSAGALSAFFDFLACLACLAFLGAAVSDFASSVGAGAEVVVAAASAGACVASA